MIAAAPARTAERVHRIGARRKPGRHGPEQQPRKKREAGCEREDQRRRARVDRQECGAREGEREQETRRAHRDEQSGDPSADGQQNTLHQRLRHDLPAGSADGEPQGGLPTPCDRAGEQQVCNVGTRDEEDEAAHAEENLEAAAVLLLHDADAGARGHDSNDLSRQILDDVRHPVRRVSRVVLQPLMKDSGEPRAQAVCRRARAKAPDHAQPRRDGLAEDRRVAVDQRLLLNRNPQVRRIATQSLAEESRRRHADDRERVALDDERGADHRGVGAVRPLPDVMAHHNSGRGRRQVVGRVEHPTAEGADAERREVVARHELGTDRPRCRVHILTPHAEARATSLKRGELLELRQLRLESLVEGKREHPPAILGPALDAAGVAVPDPVQAGGVAHGQRAKHDCMDQGEDRCRATDAEGERQDRRDREDTRQPELTQRVADFADECTHECS